MSSTRRCRTPMSLRHIRADGVAVIAATGKSATNSLTWDELLDSRSAWATLAVGSDQALDDFAGQRPACVEARIVRGQHCRTFAELRREWAAALQFPWYLGNNW